MNLSENDSLSAELKQQQDESFRMIISTDEKLTQFSFLANSGGAVAVLSFIGTGNANSTAIIPLALFILGVICCGIEYRALLKFFAALHADATDRRSNYHSGNTDLNELVPQKNVGGMSTKINHCAGLAAQGFFILGALIGVLGLVCTF